MEKVLIFADTNARATISEIRSLTNLKEFETHIAINKNNLRNWILYRNLTIHYYKKNQNIVDFLLNIKNKIGNYTLLPNGESILRKALEQKSFLHKKGVILPIPSLKEYLRLSDKQSFVNLCKQYGIETPETKIIDHIVFTEKLVIKPVHANSSEVLRTPLLIENAESYSKFHKLGLKDGTYFVQKYIYGPGYYYCAHYNAGIKSTSFIQKNLHQQPNGGSVIKAIPASLPRKLISKIDDLMSGLNWDGVMMFELKQSEYTHKFYAIECNPRFWGPLQLAKDNGVDFVRALLGIDQKHISTNEYGYLWLWGYLKGIILKYQTKTSFQKFKHKTIKLRYKDIWLRWDTFPYFVLEPIYIINDFINQKN
jgi:predicted ATP-grasp superfamily ATP-dependent carboligase